MCHKVLCIVIGHHFNNNIMITNIIIFINQNKARNEYFHNVYYHAHNYMVDGYQKQKKFLNKCIKIMKRLARLIIMDNNGGCCYWIDRHALLGKLKT